MHNLGMIKGAIYQILGLLGDFVKVLYGHAYYTAVNETYCVVVLLLDCLHDDVIKWEHFLRYWPFVRGIHRSPVDSLLKGQWRAVLTFSLICAWTSGWANNVEPGDLRRLRAHYRSVMCFVLARLKLGFCRSLYSRTASFTWWSWGIW